jgi:hypothetical protein
VYVTATGLARQVAFAIDNQPVRTERIAPFDLGGTDQPTGRARPWGLRSTCACMSALPILAASPTG